MRTLIVAFLLAVGIAAVMTPLVLHLSRRLRLYDVPDGVRKIHTREIPRTGGVAIAAGFFAPLIGLLFYTNTFSIQLLSNQTRMLGFIVGALAILALGVVDDLRGLGAWSKLSVQFAVAALLWVCGVSFDQFKIFGTTIELGLWSLPITMIWVAGIINAMNLIDGLDGLAGGVAFFASASLFIVAALDGNLILGLFAACLAGSVLGFLLYNFSPALIFMGDAGSMTMGYVFAAAGLWSTGKRATTVALLLPLVALGVPIIDTLFAIFRRTIRGQSPFSSDRGHIHHRLLDAGYTQRQAVLILYGVCVTLTVVAVAVHSADDPVIGLVLLALVGAAALVVRAVGLRRAMLRSRGPAAPPAPEPPCTEEPPGAAGRGSASDGQAVP